MSIVLPAVNINGKCKRRKEMIRGQFQRDVPDSYMKSILRPNVCHYSFAKEVKHDHCCGLVVRVPFGAGVLANPPCLVIQTVRRDGDWPAVVHPGSFKGREGVVHSW